MIATSSQLRLRIEAHFAGNEPLYVFALETVSIVGLLYELAQQLAVTLSESFLDDSEYAATLVQVLGPLASTSRILPPGAAWRSHATLRLNTEIRMVEDSDETENVVVMKFTLHDVGCDEEFDPLSMHAGGKQSAAYDEEARIIRALDGFGGDAATLLERLKPHMEQGALLARTQLFYTTAHRAQIALRSIYTEDPVVQEQIEESATWLLRRQGNESLLEESVTSARLHIPAAERRH